MADGSVVRLVAENQTRTRACSDCRFYHPDGNFGGFANAIRRLLRLRERWGADAHHFAVCSAFGGQFAHVAREYDCGGEFWERGR